MTAIKVLRPHVFSTFPKKGILSYKLIKKGMEKKLMLLHKRRTDRWTLLLDIHLPALKTYKYVLKLIKKI